MNAALKNILDTYWYVDHDVSLQRDVLRTLIGSRSWAGIVFGQIFVAWAFAIIRWQADPNALFIVWALVLTFIVIGQAALTSNLIKGDLDEATIRLVRLRFTVFAALVGLCWIVAAFLLFPTESGELQLFFTFAFGGMAMSAVATQHVFLPACFASMGLAIPCLAIQFYRLDADYNLVQAILLVLYTVVLWSMAIRLHQFAMTRLRLQREKETLLEEVSKKAEELERARSAEREAREDAEEANAAKSRFLAQSSHDLRQPLHAIGLFLETIPANSIDNRVSHIIDRVKQSLDVLSKLFDSLLDVTLLDTGQVVVKKANFRIDDVLEQTRRDFAPIAKACNVDLRIVRSSLHIHSDPVIARRMIQNLVSNAIRHAENGQVLLGVRRRGRSASIEVHDTGRGISKEDQEKIFREFTRLDVQHTESAPGLGLGLAIVRRMASILGVQVEVSSKLEMGSVFQLNGFDVTEEPVVSVEPSTGQKAGPQLENLRVAIFDDDAETLEATGALLANWGCDVRLFSGWPADLGDRPQVLVCDYELGGGVKGTDVIGSIREQEGAGLPAIVISGNTSPELRARVQAMNIPILHKPVRPVQLRSAMLYALSDLES